jgi:large subunit ribosomal protein L23
MDEVIIEPVLTEKSNIMREANKYAFKVSSRANKLQVMDAVRRLFDVHPLACSIMTVKRKPKRVRYRKGYTSAWKKAIVTLPAGEKISLFEGA